MDVNIGLTKQATSQDSQALNALADILEGDYDLQTSRTKKESEPGVKDAGLTIALTIIGLGVTSIGTLISALIYWKSQQPKYSVTVKRGNVTILLDNISKEDLRTVTDKLQAAETPDFYVVVDPAG